MFKATGGKIVLAEELPSNTVIQNVNITYTSRQYENFTVHYFVNTSSNDEDAEIAVSGQKLDIYNGELQEFYGKYHFEPWGSLMIIENDTENDTGDNFVEETETTFIRPEVKCKVLGSTGNTITLDKCDYYFDGELQEERGYVLNICERANLLERKVKIHQDYHVKIDYIPEKLYLVCETPEKFIISVNGIVIEQKIDGYFVDKSFKKIEITKYILQGENIISFDCDFRQSDRFYENLKKARVFESEKNKLAYDMEIEAVYLLGDFSVRTDGEWTALEKDAWRYKGDFIIDAPKAEIEINQIEKQGYPFFCGSLELMGKINIQGENPILDINWKGINAIKIEIGNVEKLMLTNNRLPLKEFGVHGITEVKFTIINNLRNLLGPHHLQEGESYFVGPNSFFKEPCVWNANPQLEWNEDYCFVETGIC